MIESAVTLKRQTTLPKAVHQAFRVVPRDRARYVTVHCNEGQILPIRPLSRPFGALTHDGPNSANHVIAAATWSGADILYALGRQNGQLSANTLSTAART